MKIPLTRQEKGSTIRGKRQTKRIEFVVNACCTNPRCTVCAGTNRKVDVTRKAKQ